MILFPVGPVRVKICSHTENGTRKVNEALTLQV